MVGKPLPNKVGSYQMTRMPARRRSFRAQRVQGFLPAMPMPERGETKAFQPPMPVRVNERTIKRPGVQPMYVKESHHVCIRAGQQRHFTDQSRWDSARPGAAHRRDVPHAD